MKDLAAFFLRLGVLGFGGPLAVMAMMEEEACGKRRWLTRQHFSEMYAVLKVMPGPLATQMAIHIGTVRAGALGGLVAGGMFILPAFLLLLGLSYLYVNTGAIQTMPKGALGSLQAGAMVVILLSTLQLARPYRAKKDAGFVGVLSGILILVSSRSEPLIILAAGLSGAYGARRRTLLHGFCALGACAPFVALGQSKFFQIFWVFFKAGAFVFGSGLAIVPMLEADTVRHLGWLTHSEFMDGLVLGQVTPGPVVITSTFIGYKAAGFLGAVIATVGIFLPSFLNVILILPRIWKRVSGTPEAAGFAAWAIPAVVGAILVTTIRLGVETLLSPVPVLVFVIAFGVAWKWKPPAWILIPGAGLGGALLQFLL